MKPIVAAIVTAIGSTLLGLALVGLLTDAARVIPLLPGPTTSALLLLPAAFLLVIGLVALRAKASGLEQATTHTRPTSRWLRAVNLFTLALSACVILMASHGLFIRFTVVQEGRPLLLDLLMLVAGIANGWRALVWLK